MDIEQNINIYRQMDIVNYYSNDILFEPEKQILSIIQEDLNGSKVLDIGVGAGRTTLHFSKKAKFYIGIDYSSEMIKRCKERYANIDNITFKVFDIRNLDTFDRDYFDIVLFSYNGLDYMKFSDRSKALKNINRVLKYEGKFIFSTHNIMSIEQHYKLYKGFNPILFIKRLIKVIKLLAFNGFPKKYLNIDYTTFIDGAHNFNLITTFVSLFSQIEALYSFGYNNIRTFSSNNGDEIMLEDLGTYTEPWIYFYCSKE